MEQSKIMETYNGVLERMGSRFMVNGRIAGMLFIVSSKKSEYDFLESYIRKKVNDPSVKVCDAKLWEVKPTGTYSGKTFKVAVGGSNMPSKIIPDDQDPELYIRQGYDIIEPPIEFKGRFEMDIQAALMNIAGISISNVTKFMTYESVSKCYCKRKNPFTMNIITIGTKDKLTLSDYFLPELVPEELYSLPLFIHIDTSLTGDRTGLGCVAAKGYRYQSKYSIDENDYIPTKELLYEHIFTIGIQAPDGAEISFQKTREFIYHLKYNLQWNIKGISTDGYQSADTRQQLETMGFKDVSLLSLDRTPNGYMTGKACVNEGRINMIYIPELETEVINLEQDNMTGKVDHRPDQSKDMSDGTFGALYNASLHESEFNFYLSEDAENITATNDISDNDYSKNLLNSLVQSKYNPNIGTYNIIDNIDSNSGNNSDNDNMLDDIMEINNDYIIF